MTFTAIVIRSFVYSIICTLFLTRTAAGKEVVYDLGMWMLKKYTGYGKSSVCWIDGTRVWSVEFRDGSRFCVDRNEFGSRVRTTGKMASIFNKGKENLYTLVK